MKHRLHLRQVVLHLDAAVLSRDVVVDDPAAQRTRTIERVERDEVLETLRLGLAQRVAHARALELEDAVGLAVLEDLVALRIVERNVHQIDDVAGRLLDVLDGVVEQRQRAETEKVHLQQTDPLDLLHRPLRRDLAVVLLAPVEGHELGQRFRRDHDAGGVDGRVTRHAFEPLRDFEQLVDARVVLLEIGERRHVLERQVERHVELARNQVGDPVHVGDRHLHDAADVAHGRLRLHRAERDDLRDVLAPVLLGDVGDDLAAAALAEVDVDIRQRDALRIQEPLEVQVEMQRIDVGDLHRIGDQAARRRPAARADRNALLARMPDEVPDDQEIPGVVHPPDQLDLVGRGGFRSR